MAKARASALPRGEPRTVDVNGTTIFVEEFGDANGIPALLIPGGPGCSHEYLNPLGAALADRVHGFAIDTRGTGGSGRPDPATMTHAQMVEDYERVRAALGIDSWILIGHSYGGFLSLEYVLARPESVRGLVLIGSGSAMDMGHLVGRNAQALSKKYPAAARAFARGAYEGDTPDDAYNHHMQAILPLFFKEHDAAVAAPLAASRFSAHGEHAWGHALAGYDVTNRLGEIRCPTLVIDGTHDFILPVEQQRRLHHGIGGSKLVLLESSGHFPFLEDPDAFYAAVRGWMVESGL